MNGPKMMNYVKMCNKSEDLVIRKGLGQICDLKKGYLDV